MIIIAPVRTEKAVSKMELGNTVTFVVADSATKTEVAREVEKLFGVKVDSVRIINRAKGGKRAMVKLAKGMKTDDIVAKLKII